MKWSWVRHVAGQGDSRWTKRITDWKPRLAGKQIARNKESWKKAGVAYVQDWTMKGC